MRRSGQLVAFAGLLFIAEATLLPLPQQTAAAEANPIWCLVCGDYGGVDVVLNVLLFIPFAFGLRWMGVPPALVVVIGSALSLVVESLQLALIPGRDASLSDLVTNTMGSLFGAALGFRMALILTPAPTQARRLAVVGGAVWLFVQLGSGLLLRPWIPHETLRGEWIRTLPGQPPFAGSLTRAVISGSPMSPSSLPVDSQVQARLREGQIQLMLDLVSGPPVPEWAPVFELMGRNGPLLAVSAVGSDLAFQPPARSYALRLRRPAIRLSGALPLSPGTTLQLTSGESGDTLWASWSTPGERHRRIQALSPSFGWSLLLPFDYAYGSEVHLLTGLWIAGLLAPISYWASRTQAARFPAALSLLLFAGLALIPALTGYPAVHWSEWLAGAAGLATGWAVHRAAAYLGK